MPSKERLSELHKKKPAKELTQETKDLFTTAFKECVINSSEPGTPSSPPNQANVSATTLEGSGRLPEAASGNTLEGGEGGVVPVLPPGEPPRMDRSHFSCLLTLLEMDNLPQEVVDEYFHLMDKDHTGSVALSQILGWAESIRSESVERAMNAPMKQFQEQKESKSNSTSLTPKSGDSPSTFERPPQAPGSAKLQHVPSGTNSGLNTPAASNHNLSSRVEDRTAAKESFVEGIFTGLKEIDPASTDKLLAAGGKVTVYTELAKFMTHSGATPSFASPKGGASQQGSPRSGYAREKSLVRFGCKTPPDSHGNVNLTSIEGVTSLEQSIEQAHRFDESPTAEDNATLSFCSSLALSQYENNQEVCRILPKCVVLMLDISGFSLVTSTLQDQGRSAYVLSSIVNGYMSQMIEVAQCWGGDIVKFAGDAIIVLWYREDIKESAILALNAAAQIQIKCPEYQIEDSGMSFTVHLGVSSGQLKSYLFQIAGDTGQCASSYHFLSGPVLGQVSTCAALATQGQICISDTVIEALGAQCHLETLPVNIDQYNKVMGIPHEITVGTDKTDPLHHNEVKHFSSGNLKSPSGGAGPAGFKLLDYTHTTTLSCLQSKAEAVSRTLEKQCESGHEMAFIPVRIGERVLGGINRFFLSEMRFLTVLFISYGGGVSSIGVWFRQVFNEAREHNCSIIQVVDDDKGIHIVAAAGLYSMNRSAADDAIQLAVVLRKSNSNCCLGVASGEVFCGVTGCNSACAWDIAGPAVVSACRCMEYGMSKKLTEVFHESVLKASQDHSLLHRSEIVTLKGNAIPVQLFVLQPPREKQKHQKGGKGGDDSNNADHNRSLNLHFTHKLSPNVHREVVGSLKNIVSDRGSEGENAGISTIVIKGPFGTGKFSIALNSLNGTDFLPLVHLATESLRNKHLAVLDTIAAWFVASDKPKIHKIAADTLQALDKQERNHAFVLGIELLTTVLAERKRIALIVRRAQLLDSDSVEFICKAGSVFASHSGWVSFNCVFPVFFNVFPEQVFHAIGHNVKQFNIETVTEQECRALLDHVLAGRTTRELADAIYAKSSGHLESILELSQFMSASRWLRVQKDGTTTGSHGVLSELRTLSWSQCSTTLKANTISLMDPLPPRLLTMVKTVCSITRQPGISAFFHSLNAVCIALTDSPLQEKDIAFLQDLMFLRLTVHKCSAHTGNSNKLDAAIFFILPVRDIVQHLQVPDQDKEINKICGIVYGESHPMNHPLQFLVRARHYHFAEVKNKFEECMSLGWKMLTGPRGPEFTDVTAIRRKYMETAENLDREAFLDIFGSGSEGERALLEKRKSFLSQQQRFHSPSFGGGSVGGGVGGSVRGGGGGGSSSAPSSYLEASGLAASLLKLKRYDPPLALGPVRQHYTNVLRAVFQLYELIENSADDILYGEAGSDQESEVEDEEEDERALPTTTTTGGGGTEGTEPKKISSSAQKYKKKESMGGGGGGDRKHVKSTVPLPQFCISHLSKMISTYISSFNKIGKAALGWKELAETKYKENLERKTSSVSSTGGGGSGDATDWNFCFDKGVGLVNLLISNEAPLHQVLNTLCGRSGSSASTPTSATSPSPKLPTAGPTATPHQQLLAVPVLADVVNALVQHIEHGIPSLLKCTQRLWELAQSQNISISSTTPVEAFSEFPSICTAIDLCENPSEPVGKVLYILFETLGEITSLTASDTRRTAFCDALYLLSVASRGLPEELNVVRQSFAVFLKLWIQEEVQSA